MGCNSRQTAREQGIALRVLQVFFRLFARSLSRQLGICQQLQQLIFHGSCHPALFQFE
jgi:hypothetical protein